MFQYRLESLASAVLALALIAPLPASAAGTANDSGSARSATAPAPEFPQLNLSAEAWREVAQDRVAVVLAASHEAQDPGPAQAQVNRQLEPVLARLKGLENIEVQSAGYRTDPVWKDSRIVAWRARGAIRLAAAPSEAFNALVGELAGALNVESVSHFLSREARTAVEQSLIADAVAAFRAKADAATSALGYAGWTVRALSVGDSGGGQPEPMPKVMMARSVAADSAAPMPIAEGRTTVSVNVSGTVVLGR